MGVTIEKGTPILIPVFSLQRDEELYPNPDQFDPTRFSNENRSNKSIYLPFGDGPRNCIGMRMGKMSTKIGIVSILQKYKVELDERHIGKELEFSLALNVMIPNDGIHLKFRRR